MTQEEMVNSLPVWEWKNGTLTFSIDEPLFKTFEESCAKEGWSPWYALTKCIEAHIEMIDDEACM